MKIKFWDRVILFLGALLAAVAGIFLVIIGLQFGSAGGGLTLGVRIVSIVLGLLCLLLSSFLFMLPQKLSYNKHDFVVQNTDNGELRIAVKAIENLVQKCIDVHDEINVISMQVNNNRDGVGVDLCISLPSNISIPLAVASLQKQIKQYLTASSGIDVKEVRVSVETAETEADMPASLMPDENMAAVEIPVQKKEKKLPLHRRIFSKGEQNITVPEPPKAEAPAEETVEMPEEIPAEEAAEIPEETPVETPAEIPAEVLAEEIPAAPVAEEEIQPEETPAESSATEEEQPEKEDASNE